MPTLENVGICTAMKPTITVLGEEQRYKPQDNKECLREKVCSLIKTGYNYSLFMTEENQEKSQDQRGHLAGSLCLLIRFA
jgi:hypothetical protein